MRLRKSCRRSSNKRMARNTRLKSRCCRIGCISRHPGNPGRSDLLPGPSEENSDEEALAVDSVHGRSVARFGCCSECSDDERQQSRRKRSGYSHSEQLSNEFDRSEDCAAPEQGWSNGEGAVWHVYRSRG